MSSSATHTTTTATFRISPELKEPSWSKNISRNWKRSTDVWPSVRESRLETSGRTLLKKLRKSLDYEGCVFRTMLKTAEKN